MLETGAVVAAEMRRVDHFDRELVLLRQREEAARNAQRVLNEFVVDAVAGQIKEADAAGRRFDVREAEFAVHDVMNVFMCTGFNGATRINTL